MTFACLSMKDLVDILKIRISHKSHKGTIPRKYNDGMIPP